MSERFLGQDVLRALWLQVRGCDVPSAGRAGGLCAPELSWQEGHMVPPLELLFYWGEGCSSQTDLSTAKFWIRPLGLMVSATI